MAVTVNDKIASLLSDQQGGFPNLPFMPGVISTPQATPPYYGFEKPDVPRTPTISTYQPDLKTKVADALFNAVKGSYPGSEALGLLGQVVYHGSPFKFDTFKMEKAGKHGGSSFGSGLNFSEDVGHAKAYMGPSGHMYKADIPDEEIAKFIHWNKPVASEIASQLPPFSLEGNVKLGNELPFGKGAYLKNVSGQWKLFPGHDSTTAFNLRDAEIKRMFGNENTGEQIYRKLVAVLGDEETASKWLLEKGIKGITNREANVNNYVVFDETLPKILERK